MDLEESLSSISSMESALNMGYSYKTYSDTKEVMKKYVNAAEGEEQRQVKIPGHLP